MPRTYTRTFRVRYYECDAYGHLNSVNYLRYMQETAFDASADAGYDQQRYALMNRYWLIRETIIEYLHPLHYSQEVEVKTWIADFYPEGKPASFPARQPFLKTPGPAAEVYSTRRQVTWHDIDSMRHINNAVYMTYASECGFQAIAAFGWPLERMIQSGFAIVIRRCQIQYLRPGLLDDELEVATWAADVRRSMATRHYTIQRINDGALLSQVKMFSVWVDFKTNKPVRIPQQFLKDFASNIVTD